MKKNYIEPIVEITPIEVDGMLQTLSKPKGETTVDKDFELDDTPGVDTGGGNGGGANDAKGGTFIWDDEF